MCAAYALQKIKLRENLLLKGTEKMENAYQELKYWIEECDNIVFLGGAGVSTESGIPDFRGENGLYRQKREIPLEKILSHDFFMEHPEEFYRYLRSSAGQRNLKPNQAHIRLAELEREGKVKAVITQNVDGLHQKAGSKAVYELHGNSDRFYCINCGKKYSYDFVAQAEDVPRCVCGGLIRPGAVFFGEPLDAGVLRNAVEAVRKADMLIVGGTSLVVYPAAGLVDYYSGDRLVLINEQVTPYDIRANLTIKGKIGQVFTKV